MPSEMYNPNPEETPEQRQYREAVSYFIDITDKLVNQKVSSALRAMGYDPDNLSAGSADGRAYDPSDPEFQKEFTRFIGIRSGIEGAMSKRAIGRELRAEQAGEAVLIAPKSDGQPRRVTRFVSQGDAVVEEGADRRMELAEVQELALDLDRVYRTIEEVS